VKFHEQSGRATRQKNDEGRTARKGRRESAYRYAEKGNGQKKRLEKTSVVKVPIRVPVIGATGVGIGIRCPARDLAFIHHRGIRMSVIRGIGPIMLCTPVRMVMSGFVMMRVRMEVRRTNRRDGEFSVDVGKLAPGVVVMKRTYLREPQGQYEYTEQGKHKTPGSYSLSA
jgi:hypothetical protein